MGIYLKGWSIINKAKCDAIAFFNMACSLRSNAERDTTLRNLEVYGVVLVMNGNGTPSHFAPIIEINQLDHSAAGKMK